ncbi:MAG: OmpA family protein [Proteobacteria bacterium]|nr:OmpA family protein [Pseudomonadota bacterium]
MLAIASGTVLAEPPVDSAIDIQTFNYAVGPKTFFTVADADVGDAKQLAVDFLLTYLTKPFTIYNVDVTDPANPGKYRLYNNNKGFRAAGMAAISLPTSFGSDGSQYLGDNLPSVRAGMSIQYDVSRFSLGANGGVLFRKPREIYDSTIGQQFTWGVAAAVHVTDRFSIIGEGYGRKSMFDASVDASPLEIDAGLRIHATGAVAVVVGGGAGLVEGIGSPKSRFFLSVGYAPDVRDSDGDGIPNGRDRCPMVPEDKDGHDDLDGCPDDDNDGDRRPDVDDKCPNDAEDLDGFEDDDGCPELDNDGDKIPDLQDKCPDDAEDGKQPYPQDGCPANKRDSDADGIPDSEDACPTAEEDMDGFEDGDGCPEADNDGDGVPDADDKCPLCSEDKDGFEDGDGCPELDNDKDGIADAQDACPNEPETINGFKDTDGCPDAGAETVKLDGDVLQITVVPTLAGAKLTVSGTQIVDQIAMLMMAHTEVTKWLLAVAQPVAAKAATLGDAIKARLVARGIPADHLEVIGAAGPARIGGAVQERGTSDAPFVCPAGHEAKERPEAMKGGKKPATDAAVTPTQPAQPKPDLSVIDTDGDDIADADDKCPTQAETKNSYQDEDGCPDTIPTALKQFSGSVQGVNFKSGSADLLPTSFKVLDGAAKAFTEFPDLKVEVQGHTDDEPPGKGGAFPDNLALSQARANAVKVYLMQKGVAEARLVSKGYGDTVPLVPYKGSKGSALAAARTKNRRVEFKLLGGGTVTTTP